MERKGFGKLVERLEAGGVQIVINWIDLDVMRWKRAMFERLKDAGVQVHCLTLGSMDLTRPARKMTMQVLRIAHNGRPNQICFTFYLSKTLYDLLKEKWQWD